MNTRVIFLIICSFWLSNLFSQIINIPDLNFKQKLLTANSDNQIAKDLNGDYAKIDINNDGEIQTNEAINIISLDVSNYYITSLIGIQNFVNLENLWCSNNQLSILEINSLFNLQNLWCDYNQITNLNLNGLNNLQSLSCNFNLLNTLDVHNINTLQALHCSYNNLLTLNISDTISLQSLYCNNNNISNLNTSGLNNLIYIDCTYNQINTINLTGLSNLERLECRNNQLTTIDLRDSSNMQFLGCRFNQLVSLFIKNGADESINVSNNPNLNFVCADDFQLWAVQSRVSQYPNCVVSTNCDLTTNESTILSTKVLIYPNPTNKTIIINTEQIINKINIYNIFGQLILFSNNSIIDISNLSSGNYLLKILTDKGIFNGKFIKD